MRIHKYRAWYKKEKRFLKLTNRFIIQDGEIWPSEFKKDKNDRMEYCHYSPEDVVVTEFTGLHDKNKVEIYEGDVVKRNSINKEGLYNGVIEINPTQGVITNGDPLFTEFEVIGNIYQHPALKGLSYLK